MTVSELIEKLQAFPPDMKVVKPGHSDSDGFNNIYDVDEILISYADAGWRGDFGAYDSSKPSIKVVYIN